MGSPQLGPVLRGYGMEFVPQVPQLFPVDSAEEQYLALYKQ